MYVWLDTAEYCAARELDRAALSSICGESPLSALSQAECCLIKGGEQKSVPSKLRPRGSGIGRGVEGYQGHSIWKRLIRE